MTDLFCLFIQFSEEHAAAAAKLMGIYFNQNKVRKYYIIFVTCKMRCWRIILTISWATSPF